MRTKDNAPRKPDANWISGLDMLNYWGYRVEINGCDAEHFVALAVPPVASGHDGRAFCTSELGTVHVARDGSPEKCLAQGIVWSGK